MSGAAPPDPPAAGFPDWAAATFALCAAFRGAGSSGWSLAGHDGHSVHFEAGDGGPNADLLGVDFRDGVLRWGEIYLPKQDGGYHGSAPLPWPWLAALRALYERTLGALAPRFASLSEAGPALLPVAAPGRERWFEWAFRPLSGPKGAAGGPLEVVFAPYGHPLDVLGLALDRSAGLLHALWLTAGAATVARESLVLPAPLAADLAAIPPAARGPGLPLEALAGGALSGWLADAAREVLARADHVDSGGPGDPGDPLPALLALFTPSRWRLPEVEVQFSGPSWQFLPGGTRTALYGRYRGTGAWTGIAFSPDFARADYLDALLGPRPECSLGTVEVPPELQPRLAEAYRYR